MNVKTRRRLYGGLYALGLAALCVTGIPNAQAAPNGKLIEGKSTVVKFRDLNLQDPAGAEELYRRIQRAANKVCWRDTDFRTLSAIERNDCVERAVAKAVSDVDNRFLTALHVRKSNKALG
jgi:UrcA family protein